MLHTLFFTMTLVALFVATIESFIPELAKTRLNWLAFGMFLWALARLFQGA